MDFQSGLELVDKAYKKIFEANNLMTDALLESFLFTWKWWIGLGIMIIPWIAWFIFRKKESTDRLLYAGFIVIILASMMDIIGVSMGKWTYPIKIVPSTVVFIPFQISLLPVTVMFFLQIKPKFNPFIKAILFGGLGAYIGMPAFTLIDHYRPKDWKYTYSFLILIAIYLIAYWFSKRNKFDKI